MSDLTQDDLLQFLHSIHNILRNSNGIKLTGMAALNEINNFFALYFIKDKVVSKGLPEECSFDNIYETYCTDEIIKKDNKITNDKAETRIGYKLWQDVYDGKNMNCIMAQIAKHEYFGQYFCSDFTKTSAFSNNWKGYQSIQQIINLMHKKFDGVEFNYKLYDALGAAYEKFKTDEISNTGKHTGQHFTPVSIKKIIINELKPTYKDTYYEPCSGSGGFIHTACHYVYENDNKNLEKFKKKIFANEINPELIKPLMINMLLHDIPVTNINVDNECDSLSVENCKRYKGKISKCGTNVPFGVKTTLNNFGDYWDPIENKKSIIKESTAQFIVHIYHSLTEYGEAGIVVDRGILNNGSDGNSWQKKFRQWLVENVNLYKVIYMPTGIFDYTNFATAIIFFQKGYQTESISFYEAKFYDPVKKGDIYVEEEAFKVLTIDEIKEQNYSFKIELEEKEEMKEGWIKLGDVVDIQKGKNKTIDEMKGTMYRVIGGGYIPMSNVLIDEFNANENEILMSNDGAYAGYINKFNEKMFITGHCNKIILKKDTIYNIDLIYYYLKLQFQSQLLIHESNGGYQTGQAQPSINKKKMLDDIQIPNLSTEHQQDIVTFLDKQFETYNIDKLTPYLKDIKLFDLLIKKQYDLCTDALHVIYRKIETDALVKSVDRDKKAIFNMMVGLVECHTVKLGDIMSVESGNLSASACDNIGAYPFYSGKPDNPVGTHSEFTFNYEKYILMIKGGGCPEVLTRDDNSHVGMGKTFLVKGKTSVTDGLYCFRLHNTKKITYEYLHIYFTYNKNSTLKLAKFSARLGNITKTDIVKLLIKIPSLEDQQKIIEKIQQIELEQSTYKKYGEMLQEQIDGIQQVIKNLCTIQEEDVVNEIEADDIKDQNVDEVVEEESEPEPIKKPIVKKVMKTQNNKNYVQEEPQHKPIVKKLIKKHTTDEQDDEVIEVKAKPKKLVKKVVEEDDITPEPGKKSTLQNNILLRINTKQKKKSGDMFENI